MQEQKINRNRRKILFFFILFLCMTGLSVSSFAGWKKQQWRYYDEDGNEVTDQWIEGNGKEKYYVDKDGWMVMGWNYMDDGNWYYFDSSTGEMKTGWINEKDQWYFLNQNGIMITGMAEINERLYFFQEDGTLFTGEKAIGDQVRYFSIDGVSRTGLKDLELPSYFAKEVMRVKKSQEGGFSSRYLPVLVFLVCGTVLWIFTRRRPDSLYPWLVFAAAFIASAPLFLYYLIGGHDMIFHLNRILGIRDSLWTGMFPVRLNAYTFKGFGYADPVFYPNIFMYIPAILNGFGVSLPVAVNVFLVIVNCVTAAVMYKCSSSVFESKEIGCISSVIYTFCTYRLCNMYTRAAYGEVTAMIFFPLVLYGFYEIFFREERHWVFLTLGITGVVQSHIVSTLLIAIFCVAGGLFWIRQMLVKERFVACVKAVAASVLLNLWFLLPLIQYMKTEINIKSLQVNMRGESAVPLTKLLEVFSMPLGDSPGVFQDIKDKMPVTLGIVLLFGTALFFYGCWIQKKECGKKERVMFLWGIILFTASSDLFPWRDLTTNSLMVLFVSYIQFPWRFLGFAACFLSMIAAYGICNFSGKARQTICVGSVIVAVLSGWYYLDGFQHCGASVWSEEDVGSMIGQEEYLYPNPNKENLREVFVSSQESMKLTDTGRHGFWAKFTYDNSSGSGESYVDVPLFYYPGYHAINADGQELPVIRNEENWIRVVLSEQQGTIQVFFREPRLWRVMEMISLLAGLWILWELFQRGKMALPFKSLSVNRMS